MKKSDIPSVRLASCRQRGQVHDTGRQRIGEFKALIKLGREIENNYGAQ